MSKLIAAIFLVDTLVNGCKYDNSTYGYPIYSCVNVTKSTNLDVPQDSYVLITSSYLPILTRDLIKNPAHVKHLSIQSSNVTSIRGSALIGYRNVQEINLKFNEIKELRSNGFIGCGKLEGLVLSYNEIAVLQNGWCNDLRKLNSIDLRHNRISRIENGTFNLASLQVVFLSDNEIEVITPGAFQSGLKELYLANNRLSDLPVKLPFLEVLHLQGNRLASFSGKNYYNLERLNLAGNSLNYINPNKLLASSKLTYIDLNDNKINCEDLLHIVNSFVRSDVEVQLGKEIITSNVHGISCNKTGNDTFKYEQNNNHQNKINFSLVLINYLIIMCLIL